ncbi:hypothetical protein D3C75_998270 [compost metagenome]
MFFGQLAAQGTQRFPQIALFGTHQLAGRAAAAGRRGFGRGLRFEITAQLQGHLAAQQRPAAVGQAKTAVAFQVDIDQAARHQLTEQ